MSNSSLGTGLLVPEPGEGATIRRLKRAVLLFDNIAVLHLSGFINFLARSHTEPALQAELDWLLERGVLTSIDSRLVECFTNPFQEAADWFPKVAHNAVEYASWLASSQLETLQLSRARVAGGVLLCSLTPEFLEVSAPSAGRANALSIVFDAFPEPDEQTSWEQILEFKADPDSGRQIAALKRWLSKVGQQELPPGELREEIEWLVQEYEDHMRLHRMKIGAGTLESVVTATAELLENIVKLKFGATAKALFAFRQRKIQLLEAERQAPGRELIYLVRSRQRFGVDRRRR
jgi:hypothetical protein